MPWDESRRLDKNRNTADGNDESEETKNEWSAPLSAQSSSKKSAKEGNKRAAQEVYDHEVYDDRMFYAMLLKVAIYYLTVFQHQHLLTQRRTHCTPEYTIHLF